MEGRVKTRQPGTIPNNIGRQVGVLPISSRPKPRRTNSETSGSIPVGGTDALPISDTYQARPPSGSSSTVTTRSQNSTKSRVPGGSRSHQLASSSGSKLIDEREMPPPSLGSSRTSASSRAPVTTASSSSRAPVTTASSSSQAPVTTASSRAPSSRTSPGSSRLSAGTSPASSRLSAGISPASSRLSTGTSRTSPASSQASAKKSPVSSNPSQHVSKLDLDNEHVDDNNPEEQDVRFYDVPSSQGSRPGSKVKRGSGSAQGSGSHRQQENGKKPYKTIDPEEVLAMNMESDFNKIYEINLHAFEITHIDHMEQFKKVKVLDLACNFIEQITNLEFNKDLKELKLYDNRLRKIECLENLKELSSLQLQHNKIKSIGKGLCNLKKLKSLRLDCNQLLKIETPELSQCVQLTVLDISYNMLDSLTAVNYLPNLEELNASGNRLRSVSDLSKCKRLQEIDLSGNRITELSGLRGLPKLLTLNISHNQLKSFKSMGRLKSLQDLHASNNLVCELSTLVTQLPALEVLDLADNEITDWDEFYDLEEMTELVELFISGNPFGAPDGPMPHYFSAIQAVLPNLEIIDGAHIKKHIAKGAPLMRPMSASSVVSLRQMDYQMKNADEQMQQLEKSLEEKFASLRANCDSLPVESPSARLFSALSSDDTPTSSRCSSRSRILDARKFAAAKKLK